MEWHVHVKTAQAVNIYSRSSSSVWLFIDLRWLWKHAIYTLSLTLIFIERKPQCIFFFLSTATDSMEKWRGILMHRNHASKHLQVLMMFAEHTSGFAASKSGQMELPGAGEHRTRWHSVLRWHCTQGPQRTRSFPSKLGTTSQVWHHGKTARDFKPLMKSHDNLHQLQTCAWEPCLAALCSYCFRSMALTGQIFCFVLPGSDCFFVHRWDQINYFPLQPSDWSNSNGAESRNSDKRRDNVFFTVIFVLRMIKKEWRLK